MICVRYKKQTRHEGGFAGSLVRLVTTKLPWR